MRNVNRMDHWYNQVMTTHLFVRSSYSLMESTVRISQLAEKAKKLGFDCIALTDHNVLYGYPEFQHACEKTGIRPVFGMEADCLYHDQTVSFVLLARNNKGYLDLIHLSTLLCSTGQPCTLEQLCNACTDCFLIAWSEGGYGEEELVKGDEEAARVKFQQMKSELPPFFMAVSYAESGLWKIRNETVRKLCRSLKIPTVAINRIYYLDEGDSAAFHVMEGIRQDKTIEDRSLIKVPGRYLRSMQEMQSLYPEEELIRTDQIASQCRCDLKIEKTTLPSFPVPQPLTSEQYLTQLCLAGLEKRRNGHPEEVYLNRLKYELSIIARMHFEDYFLIVWDFIRYARTHRILVGPGRGSAAGSLVAYCLGITMVDPIRYHLLFERFLNPERVSMPDIDTDIPDDRRQDVIAYVRRLYGDDHVASIVAFDTFGAKQVIRDTGKVMNVPQHSIEMLERMIPRTPGITLAQALSSNQRLNANVAAEPTYRRLFQYAARLEGLPRHTTVHAAGVIMSQLPLSEIIPVIHADEGLAIGQYEAQYLEERGLIKMDFLSLRNLTTIAQIWDQVKDQERAKNVWNLPQERDVYQLFATADTTGIFQFESAGMKNLLRKMKPDCFEDIVAALALFRPASKDSIPQYLEAKRNPASIHYPVPALKEVLKDTYGVMLYQEQAMKTAQICAGFSLGKADRLRKAMSKKKKADVDAMESDFMKGCIANGYEESKARQLFTLVSRFAGYGFNKSHAVAYGLISYAMAYLKARHPLQFYCALLGSAIGDDEKTAMYLNECRRRKIGVDAPNVLTSSDAYQIRNGRLLLPLSVVKGFGSNAARTIVKEREKSPFLDYFDFCARVSLLKINRRQIELLIDAGALDAFGYNRTTLHNSLDEALSYADLIRIDANGQTFMDPGLVSKPVIRRMADNAEEVSEAERSALGFTLGPHPIINVRRKLNLHVPPLVELRMQKGEVEGFAYVETLKTHRTKKGDLMAFAHIMDETSEAELVIFPRAYASVSSGLAKGVYILFHAKIGDDGSWLAQSLQVMNPQTVR